MLSRGVQSSILDNRRQTSELCLGFDRHAEGGPPPPPGGACASARWVLLLGTGRYQASPARRDEAARPRRRAALASAGSPAGPVSWRPRPESKRASRHLRVARGNVHTPVVARALKNTLEEKKMREETMGAACPVPRRPPPLWHPLSTCSPNRRPRWREAWAPEPRLAAPAQCTPPPPRLSGPHSSSRTAAGMCRYYPAASGPTPPGRKGPSVAAGVGVVVERTEQSTGYNPRKGGCRAKPEWECVLCVRA